MPPSSTLAITTNLIDLPAPVCASNSFWPGPGTAGCLSFSGRTNAQQVQASSFRWPRLPGAFCRLGLPVGMESGGGRQQAARSRFSPRRGAGIPARRSSASASRARFDGSRLRGVDFWLPIFSSRYSSVFCLLR